MFAVMLRGLWVNLVYVVWDQIEPIKLRSSVLGRAILEATDHWTALAAGRLEGVVDGYWILSNDDYIVRSEIADEHGQLRGTAP
jgi:hypothetical protein